MYDSMEQVSYRLHEQICKTSLQKSSHVSRSLLEHFILALAVSSLVLLGISHLNFVYPRKANFVRECSIWNLDSAAGVDIVHLSIRRGRSSHSDDDDEGDVVGDVVGKAAEEEEDEDVLGYTELFYAANEAMLYMDDDMKKSFGVTETNVVLTHDDSSCFGDNFQRTVLKLFQQYETLLSNFVLHKYHSKGYIRNSLGKVTDLSNYKMPRGKLLHKAKIVVSMLITFLTLSAVVEFTLHETQMKMVDFTFKLKDCIRNDAPVYSLIVQHILNILLFVPLTIGLLYTLQLFVFNQDVYLSFGVLSLIWFQTSFKEICVRSRPSIDFFFKCQLLIYSLFHLYSQVFPHGFTHSALSVTALFSFHSMIFFFNRYELPAIQGGIIHSDRPRASIYQNRNHSRRVVVREASGTRRNGGVDSRGVPLPPRQASRPTTPSNLSRSNSTNTMPSRSNSTNSLAFQEDGVGDNEEFVVFLNGEVVLPARSAVVRRRSDYGGIVSE